MQEFFTAIRDLGLPTAISALLLWDYSKKLASVSVDQGKIVLEMTKIALQDHETKKQVENINKRQEEHNKLQSEINTKLDKLLERKR